MARLVDIRPEERRTTLAAFFTLLGITAAHTLLETARDALFLAKLPASRLPWVYLAIAAVGLIAARLNRRRAGRGKGRGGVTIALVISACVNLAFWAASSVREAPFVYTLYLWTGIFASWVIVQFWLLLGSTYTVIQAKRLYGFIGTGSVLGAVGGAAAARALAAALPAQHLLLGAAALLVLTGLGPALLMGGHAVEAESPRGPASGRSLGDDLRLVLGDPYVKRILFLVLLSTVTVTIVDYLFKATVAAEVPAERLGTYFANVYVVLNSVAFVVQFALVGWVLRTLGVHRAALITPILLFIGAGGVLAGGALVAALLLKGADGALRHSMQRTSTELLYVPIPDAKRGRAKPFIDLVGQRGGQALASVGILSLVAFGGDKRWVLAIAIACLSALWLWTAAGIRRHYLDLFRTTLRGVRIDYTADLPELDLGALEALFSALNSSKDAEVLGALDLLAAQRRERLIPALILYHPSAAIVLRALELFTREGRRDFVPIAERLLLHPDPEVRATALRARAVVLPEDEAFVRQRLDDECLEVRATALVTLLARGVMEEQEGESALSTIVRDASPAVRIALARAIAQQPARRFEAALLELVDSPETEVQMEAAWAMGKVGCEAFFPKLRALLAGRVQGAAARDALVDIGVAALAYLDASLRDSGVPLELRWRIPRAIGMFPPRQAATVLMRQLGEDSDGMLRFRILRALGALRSIDPDLPLDGAVLSRVGEQVARKALQLLSWRVAMQRAADQGRARPTPAFELLLTLLQDKETYAIARLFRVFSLLHPAENFERIQRGLRSPDVKARASSRELIENLIDPPLRQAVLALVEDLPDADRLQRAPSSLQGPVLEHDVLVRGFLARNDELASLAAVHATEMGLAFDVPTGVAPTSAGALVAGLAARTRAIAGVTP